jgi:hypothetical protein
MGSAENGNAVAVGRQLPAIFGISGFIGLGCEANQREKSKQEYRDNPLFHKTQAVLRGNDLEFLAKYPHQSLQFCDAQTPAKLVGYQLFVSGYQVKAALAQ